MMQGTRPTISSRHGMVAAAHPLAAQAGARLLASGGNAFDAAAATAAALNVVEPFMSGLAGQGLATAWVAKESRVRVLDFVPTIPKSFPRISTPEIHRPLESWLMEKRLFSLPTKCLQTKGGWTSILQDLLRENGRTRFRWILLTRKETINMFP